jgi:hypothetical protein
VLVRLLKRIPEPLRDPVGYYRWDRLRQLGNLGIMKMTVLMPLIGYLVIFNASLHEHLRLTFDPDGGGTLRLYFIYFGLTLLGIGSIVYQFACPSEVKEHGSAWEFVSREAEAINQQRLDAICGALIRWRYGALLEALPAPFRDLRAARQRLSHVSIAGAVTDDDKKLLAMFEGPLAPLDHDLHRWKQKNELMTDYFVPLKHVRSTARVTVLGCYAAGFAFLAYPTLDVFLHVCLHFATFIGAV